MKNLNKYKKLLQEERIKALQLLNAEMLNIEHSSEDGDIANQHIVIDYDSRIRARNSLYLKRIDASLNKIILGTYGLCVSCEEPISHKRLLARPITNSCISCKESQEKYEMHTIDGQRSKSLDKLGGYK